MAYSYEHSGAERFQRLCRALVEDDEQDLETLGVSVAGGGRPGSERSPDVAGKRVLQVFFADGPDDDSGNRMLDMLCRELPRISRLGERGASRYILATNAEESPLGTSGYAADVEGWLAKHCPVPFEILWRSDLDRRMDWAPAWRKLSHPEVLAEQDAVTRALSVLVPPSASDLLDRMLELIQAEYARDGALNADAPDELVARFVDSAVRGHPKAAASLLLSEGDAQRPQRRCITGGPGSGKSTLMRYVAQVQRARLLGDSQALSRLPTSHAATSFRLPLILDAASCVGSDPRSGRQEPAGTEPIPLLGWLAQVLGAGGDAAAEAALRAVLVSVPTLVILDGLDGIGNPRLRAEVADAALTSLDQLGVAGADIQFLAAARGIDDDPAPGRLIGALRTTPLDTFDPARVLEFGGRLAETRNLDVEDTGRVMSGLREAIEAADARDLAGNPLQLEMMLAVAHRGASPMPGIRADLYHERLRHALSECLDANRLLGARRHLLPALLEHLAWTLQTNAERDGATTLTPDEVAAVVDGFLRTGSEPPELAEPLLASVTGVPLLMAHPDGSLSFVHAAMREFLCARFIADSGVLKEADEVAGGVVGGHSRMAELMSNPFWTNVTRFWVQLCTSEGLSDVAAVLHRLTRSRDLASALRGRRLGALLLSDRAFRRRRDLQHQLIRVVYDRIGMRLTMLADGLGMHSTPAQDSGWSTLEQLILSEHLVRSDQQVALAGAALLNGNGGADLWQAMQEQVRASSGAERTMRLSVLFRSGAQEAAKVEDVEFLIYEDGPSPRERYFRLTALMDSGSAVFSRSPRLAGDLIAQLLRWGPSKSAYSATPVAQFANVLADGTRTVELIEGLPTARDYESAAAAVEEIRAEFGDSWATYSLAASACGIPRHSGIESTSRSLMDQSVRLCDRALAARMWRGRSTWWADELAAAKNELERMFWVVVLVAWGSAQHVVDNMAQLDTTLRGVEDEDFTVITEAVRAALRSRKVHGGRPRPPIEAPDSVHDRTAVLLTIAFAPSRMRELPARRPESSLIEEWGRRTAVEERIGSFSGWSSMGDRAARQWAWAAAEGMELGMDLPGHVEQRLKNQSMPLALAQHVLLTDHPHPVPLLENALLSAASAAVPAALGPRLGLTRL